MKGWNLARLAFECGRCGARIESGLPMFWMRPTGLSHAKKRCSDCAGEPIPDSLEDEEAPGGTVFTDPHDTTPVAGMDRFRSSFLKDLPHDFKIAQGGTD